MMSAKVKTTDSHNTIIFAFAVLMIVMNLASWIAMTNGQEPSENDGKSASNVEQTVSTDPYTNTVGFPKTIMQVKLPGSELVPKPNADRTNPIVLRIIQSYPHGSDFRYDLEYVGLDPGSYNLAEYFVRKDESEVGDLPEIRVQVNTLLPAGRIEPHELVPKSSNFSSYYLPTIVVLGGLWLIGLLFILFWGWSKTRKVQPQTTTVTFADKIKPLVERAMSGDLEPQGQAELERLLSNYWQKKLRLKHLTAHELRQTLRVHPEAGEMLGQLDRWLYDPGSDEQDVDVARLLRPYQVTETSSSTLPL